MHVRAQTAIGSVQIVAYLTLLMVATGARIAGSMVAPKVEAKMEAMCPHRQEAKVEAKVQMVPTTVEAEMVAMCPKDVP